MPRRGRTAKRLANKKFGELKKIVTFAIPIGNNPVTYCGNSSVGRAQPCQGWGREFESRFPLQIKTALMRVLFLFSGLSLKDLYCPASCEAQRSFQSRSLRDFTIPNMRCFLFSTSVENDGSHERPHPVFRSKRSFTCLAL